MVNSSAVLDIGTFTLTFNGGTSGGTITTFGPVTGIGRVLTQGDVTLNTSDTSTNNFTAALEVGSGTTKGNNQKALGSSLTIDPGATFQVATSALFTVHGDLRISSGGTFSGANTGSTLAFKGLTVNGASCLNDGVVSVANTTFNGAGDQSIAGAGTWVGSTITIEGSGTKSLASDMNLALGTGTTGTLTVKNPATFDIGTFTLTFNGGTITTFGPVTGSGKVLTHGSVTLNTSDTSTNNFTAPLEVGSGTARGNNQKALGGSLTIDPGAFFQLASATLFTVTGDVTVATGGTLSGASGTFDFKGASCINNGTISVASFRFRAEPQKLSGAGNFSSNIATVLGGSRVTVASNHRMSTVLINANGTLDTSDRTLSLSGTGTPLTNNGAFITGGSTIAYDGTSPQTVATVNITYNNLTINNAAGVTLSGAEAVPGTLTLTSGAFAFNISGPLTLGNDATISRSGGSLSGVPTFAGTVNVVYTGTAAITTGAEIPTSPSALKNLTIKASGGVTLSANATANGVLALTNGDLMTDAFTLTMPGNASSTGTTDVVGNVKRIGFVVGQPLSFGNPFNTIKFDFGTAPMDVTVNLVRAAPPNFPGTSVKRTYRISANGGGSYKATLRLHYRDSELNVSPPIQSRLLLWRLVDSTWTPQVITAADLTDNWCEGDRITAFSRWTIAPMFAAGQAAK